MASFSASYMLVVIYNIHRSGPEVIKRFFKLNSTKHENFPVGILTFMSGKNSILGLSEP